MSKIWVLPVLLAATLLGTGLLGCVQSGPTIQPRRTWQRSLFPLRIQVDTGLKEIFRNHIREAVQTWNLEIGTSVLIFEEIDIQDRIFQGELANPIPGQVIVFSAELGRSANREIVLGLARCIYAHRAIIAGIIWLDDDLVEEQVYGVALHELGHILGLQHFPEPTSVMYYRPLESSGDIRHEDVEFIRSQIRNRP
jgi:predicted Zn-dependent protease